MGLGDVNRAPRRWVDRSARVRVIEGWHPSHPNAVGFNLLVDDAWVGTYASLEETAQEASRHLQSLGGHAKRRRIVLMPHLHP